jgi:hypothetical protein
MKSEYAFKKFQKYINSLVLNENRLETLNFLQSVKKNQILFCKDEFSFDPINEKVYVRVFGEFDVEPDGDNMKTKDIDFLTIQEDGDGSSVTFYSFKGNPYGKDSPLIQEDGFIHAIPIGIKLIED